MSILCKLGFHDWDGYVCKKCHAYAPIKPTIDDLLAKSEEVKNKAWNVLKKKRTDKAQVVKAYKQSLFRKYDPYYYDYVGIDELEKCFDLTASRPNVNIEVVKNPVESTRTVTRTRSSGRGYGIYSRHQIYSDGAVEMQSSGEFKIYDDDYPSSDYAEYDLISRGADDDYEEYYEDTETFLEGKGLVRVSILSFD